MSDPRTMLESVLLADREERARSVAGLACTAAFSMSELMRALVEIQEAIEDPEKARKRIDFAFAQARHWHARFQEDFEALKAYVERNGPKQSHQELTH